MLTVMPHLWMQALRILAEARETATRILTSQSFKSKASNTVTEMYAENASSTDTEIARDIKVPVAYCRTANGSSEKVELAQGPFEGDLNMCKPPVLDLGMNIFFVKCSLMCMLEAYVQN